LTTADVRPPVDPTTVFEPERPRLLGLAYRMTGSMADAEDIVQDAWLRYERTGPEGVERPAAWLTTVVSRLALDRLRSAHHKRETYVGPWLPEPVATAAGPAEQAELRDSLTLGFLVLLERLAPVERVVFLLADVFAVPFDDIAVTVERTPAACRQIASRARKRVRDDRRRVPASEEEAWRVAVAFFSAAQAGDIDGLLAVLADDAVLTSDGGADVRAARRPVVGPDRITRFLVNLGRRFGDGATFELLTLNGEPSLVASTVAGMSAITLEVADGRVQAIHMVRNPGKLAHVGAPAGLV
jgi:RNA polymerase sigma-70 factor, ECF subfamily